MLDLIFAVDDPLAFHATNMRRHPSHYNSFLRHLSWLAPPLLAALQDWSAGVWYNTLIDLPVPEAAGGGTRLIKYGVISTERLVKDLTEWDALYIAGRMHKPMHMLICAPEIQEAAHTNLRHALATAVLLMDESKAADGNKELSSSSDVPAASAVLQPAAPAASSSAPSSLSSFSVTLRALLTRICSLSYLGDIRMGVAENPHKVANIVTGSWEQLVDLYTPLVREVALAGAGAQAARKPADMLRFPCDVTTRAQMLAALPKHFRHQIRLHDREGAGVGVPKLSLHQPDLTAPTSASTIDPYWRSLASRPAVARQELLRSSLGAIVARSSKQQTLKGLATAGVRKSLRYGMAKLRKALRK